MQRGKAEEGSSMHRIRTVPALVLAAGLAAIAMIAVLQARSDDSRRAQAELGQVGTQLNERTTAPLGVMFGAPAPMVEWHMARLKAQIDSTISELRQDTPVEGLDDVERALVRNYASGESVMALMEQMRTPAGREALAKGLTTQDAALTGLLSDAQESSTMVSGALERAREQYAERARQARLQATVGTGLAIGLLLLAFGVMYRRALRARAEAEALAAENAALAAAARHEALTDALTHLGNRRALIAALDEAIADVESAPLALALFDLDGFKHYNDTFGHQAGDALLARLAARLVERLHGRGDAYRMGGDEFCVLARTDGDEAESLARTGAEALSEAGDGYSIGCSYGLALAPADASSAEDALRIADQRMYARKLADRPATVTPQAADGLLRALAGPADRPA
jgi:diguanylate cyclase (GGDEF)-like protein